MNGVTRVLANTRLMAKAQGYRVEEVVATAANGTRTVTQSGYDQTGDRVFVVNSVTSANGLSITNRFDQDGDGVVDRLQSLQTVLNANGSRTETVFKRQGNRKDSPSRGRLDETLPRDLGRIVIPAFQRLRRGAAVQFDQHTLRAHQRGDHNQPQLQRVGHCLRRCKDDHSLARPSHMLLPRAKTK
jgi:hypothetical protein